MTVKSYCFFVSILNFSPLLGGQGEQTEHQAVAFDTVWGFRPVLPFGAGGMRQADSQTLCLPQTKSGKTLLPPFLKSWAFDYDGTVALFTFVLTAEA